MAGGGTISTQAGAHSLGRINGLPEVEWSIQPEFGNDKLMIEPIALQGSCAVDMEPSDSQIRRRLHAADQNAAWC
jgi:hypothetical protein